MSGHVIYLNGCLFVMGGSVMYLAVTLDIYASEIQRLVALNE